MKSRALFGCALLVFCGVLASRGARSQEGPAPSVDFAPIAAVLQSPRCLNCHPAGDTPLVGDAARPHPMGVKRDLDRLGMACQTCHRATAVDPMTSPPAVPNWHMPPATMPMVFQGLTSRALCEHLKDPAQNGGKDLPALLEHVKHDALVLYGWNPGGGRTLPPLSHTAFVGHFEAWVQAGAPCGVVGK
jgi:hypothetical protein